MALILGTSNSKCAITDMDTTVGFDNVEKLFQSHAQVLSNENLMDLEKELNDDDYESSDKKPVETPFHTETD
jgi:hypothetical protein